MAHSRTSSSKSRLAPSHSRLAEESGGQLLWMEFFLDYLTMANPCPSREMAKVEDNILDLGDVHPSFLWII